MAHSWGYGQADGPKTWACKFPSAEGSRQSPIDIKREEVQYDQKLSDTPLKLSYHPEKALRLCNNGHTVKADCTEESTLTGGPLGSSVYRLAQFHLHWGGEDQRGSEHTIDGTAYSAELHLVHWKVVKYESIDEAVNHCDGLAVLCIFIKVGNKHKGFDTISSQLKKITSKDVCCNLSVTFDPFCLLPSNIERFWAYPGSLTTPPCNECVLFILFEEVAEFSSEQMEALRSLHVGGKGCGHLVDNFRPTCPLGARQVLASFHN